MERFSGLAAAPSRTGVTPSASPRLGAIDALRGLAMVLMALDHVRDFFHVDAMHFSPEDLTKTYAALFFTRWITHFCAPVFAFTAGMSAFLWLQRNGRTKAQLSAFLWKRGLWLILLEITAVRFAFTFGTGPVLLLVFWSLGWSMIFLAALIWLPVRILAIFSIAVIALHNLLDPIQAARFGRFGWLWSMLHAQGAVKAGPVVAVFGYPLVPWFAVMAAGYCFARVFTFDGETRRRWMVRIGAAATAAFVLLRAVNVYGDPQPWSTALHPVLSFLRVTKYPPSLDFLLMTLGPALVLLAWFDKRQQWSARNPLVVFGRVPLFYFVVHLFVAHVLVVLFAYLRYGRADFAFTPVPSMGGALAAFPPDFGYSLGATYGIWLLVVALLYPMCVWYSELKARKQSWWMKYV